MNQMYEDKLDGKIDEDFWTRKIERIVQESVRQDWANHSPYTKGNFEFERVVTGWRGIHVVLDLRLKK